MLLLKSGLTQMGNRKSDATTEEKIYPLEISVLCLTLNINGLK
ncbi:hypothetical Protein YC6258_05501 [Gynuella sunshinyii YC6258]|uniref:Uncharacterized protein n=1 Tax=Gynuella sunshinyii YC6258 TaxID=1445510 RepID=A0A0C5W4I8_9GAMM|nr:hypothetical Protein YC6258_05501 [Gynuella sunshinyii YC6258]